MGIFNSIEKCAADASRVKLQSKEGVTSDYINANYVDVRNPLFHLPRFHFSFSSSMLYFLLSKGVHEGGTKYYIASQAPKPETLEDFWRMIWETNVRVVVKLTNLEEGGRIKAHQYWPNAGTKKYGGVTVTLSETVELSTFIIRRLVVKMVPPTPAYVS